MEQEVPLEIIDHILENSYLSHACTEEPTTNKEIIMRCITIVDSGNQHTLVKGHAIVELIKQEVQPIESCWSFKTATIMSATKSSPTLAALITDLECEKGVIFDNACNINFY